MKGLLVRVGADQSDDGGKWNGTVNSTTGRFVYVAIPEKKRVRKGLEKPYRLVEPALTRFAKQLPSHLADRHMHLDPDFNHLTYGDVRQRAKQIRNKVGCGDLLVFYAGLRDTNDSHRLVYAIIGLYVVKKIRFAREIPSRDADINAHTRRWRLKKNDDDIVVFASPKRSGRLKRCLPIGEYRDRAYRVQRNILKDWGGLSVKNGYLQRSARLPVFKDAAKFYAWFLRKNPKLLSRNNPK